MATTITATPEPDASPPRVRLDVTWSDTFHLPTGVYRVDQDGERSPVRGTETGIDVSGGEWTGYDYESPFGLSADYVVTAPVIAEVATDDPVILDVTNAAWLRHPGAPSLSMVVNVEGDDAPVRKASKAVLEPVGRQLPIVITDGRRKAKTSTITFRTYTLAELDDLVAITDDTSPLLLDVPPSWGWGITHQYMALGDLTETRNVPTAAWLPYRDFTAPYEVVDRPVSGTGGPRTWLNLVADNATWKIVRTRYAKWSDVVTGRTR